MNADDDGRDLFESNLACLDSSGGDRAGYDRQSEAKGRKLVGCCLLVWICLASLCIGQEVDRRRRVLDSMLDTLIDSATGGSRSSPQRAEGARADAVTVQLTAEQLREVRANLAGFAQEITQLVTVLHRDASRTSGVRSLLGDALRVNAAATLLARESTRTNDLTPLLDDYRKLDQDWRLLAHRLQQLRDLTDTAKRHLQRGDQFSKRLNELLQTSPQLNRDELARLSNALAEDLLHLLEEIDFDVDDEQTRSQLLIDGRRVYQQARQLAAVAQRLGDVPTIRQEYQLFRDLWEPFAARVRQLQRPYIDRQLLRVQDTERQLREMLLLPGDLDRAQLQYMTGLLQRDVDSLLDNISLRDLTEMVDGQQKIVVAASEFAGAVRDFAESVQAGEEDDTLAEIYYYLEEEWDQLSDVLDKIPGPEARRQAREIKRAVDELRDLLGIEPPIDRQRVMQLVSRLENLAAHYRRDVRLALTGSRQRYPQNFRRQLADAADRFYGEVQQLNAMMIRNEEAAVVRNQVQKVLAAWSPLRGQVGQLAPIDREHLDKLRQQLQPLLVDLQATFSL